MSIGNIIGGIAFGVFALLLAALAITMIAVALLIVYAFWSQFLGLA